MRNGREEGQLKKNEDLKMYEISEMYQNFFLFFSGFKSTLHAEGLNPLHKQLPKWPTSSFYLFSEHLTSEFFCC